MQFLVDGKQLQIAIKKVAVVVFLFFTFSIYSQGFQIPEKPSFQTSVYDYVNLLEKSQKESLENKLVRYSDTTSTQIVVAIISSTEGENINYLAANWGEKWGIGDKEKDNGVLVLLAYDDRYCHTIRKRCRIFTYRFSLQKNY